MRPRPLLQASLFLPGLLAAGCSDSSTVKASDVLSLSLCPESSTCDLVADGRSTVTVLVSLSPSVTEPLADLSVNLSLTAGAWVNAADPTNPARTSVRLSGEGRALPAFVTSTAAEVVRVDAELSGFTVQKFVTLSPAPLDALEIVPMPPRLSEGPSNEVALSVKVRAKGLGRPSAGTRVSFSLLDRTPETAAVLFYPQKTLTDPATSTASTTMEILGEATSIHILVTATAPDLQDGAPPASIEETLELVVAPPR